MVAKGRGRHGFMEDRQLKKLADMSVVNKKSAVNLTTSVRAKK